MWAETKWIETKEAWREVRATEAGLLDGIPGRVEAPAEDEDTHPGGFSLVTHPGEGRVKKLPSLYVNNTHLYAHRDVAVVGAKLRRAAGLFMSSWRTPTYMLTACEIDGRKGLFGSDFFNRSAYRSRLARLGMRFSDDPFVTFDGDDRFESEDFEPFTPGFLTMPLRSDRPPGVIEWNGALLVHQFTFYRIADISALELAALVRLTTRVRALSATEPEDLAAALTGTA